jgi:hypothetical protein
LLREIVLPGVPARERRIWFHYANYVDITALLAVEDPMHMGVGQADHGNA